MGKKDKKARLIENNPALGEVLDWWSDERHANGQFGGLRKEILRLRASWKRLSAVRDSAAALVAMAGDAAGEDLKKLDASLHRLLWNFALADEIALHYHGIQRRASRRILVFVALFGGGFWVLKYASQLFAQPVLGELTLGVVLGWGLVAGAGLISLVERSRFHRHRNRFLLSRTLAEALRVDLAQKLAGTGLDTVAEFSRQHQIADDAAFPRAVLVSALDCAAGSPPGGASGGMELARMLWLEEQLRFFGDPAADEGKGDSVSRVERQRRCHRRAESGLSWGVRCLILFLVLAQGMWALRLWGGLSEPMQHGALVAGAVSELLLALSGLLVGYFHQVSALHAVSAQKYHRARLFLVDALQALRGETREAERRAIFERTGKQALAETADWGVHQREHTPRAAFR